MANLQHHSVLRDRVLGAIACFATLLTLACAQPALGQVPDHAIARLLLANAVDDARQFSIGVPARDFMASYRKYLDDYAVEYLRVDEEVGRAPPAGPGPPALPTLREAQRSTELWRAAHTRGATLLNSFLDALAPSVPDERKEAFAAYRDECHIRLMDQRLFADFFGTGFNPPTDMGAWLSGTVDVGTLAPDARIAFAQARAVDSSKRRAAREAMLPVLIKCRLDVARAAEASGNAGAVDQSQDAWNAGKLPEDRWNEWARVSLDAWIRAAPLVPDSARHYAGGPVFGSICNIDNSDMERVDSQTALVLVDRVIFSQAVSTVRTALSIPSLTEDQRKTVRSIGTQWLQERYAALEARAIASLKGAPLSDRNTTPEALQRKFREKLAEATGAQWFLYGKGFGPGAPTRESLQLSEEDDALFPNPSGMSSLWPPWGGDPNLSLRYQGRAVPPGEAEFRAIVHLLLPSVEQAAQLRASWDEWKAKWTDDKADELDIELGKRLAAVVPTSQAPVVQAFARGRMVDRRLQVPTETLRSVANPYRAALTNAMSAAGRMQACTQVLESHDALLTLADTMLRTRLATQNLQELGDAHQAEAAAFDAYDKYVGDVAVAVAGTLTDKDAVLWRRGIAAQVSRRAAASMEDVAGELQLIMARTPEVRDGCASALERFARDRDAIDAIGDAAATIGLKLPRNCVLDRWKSVSDYSPAYKRMVVLHRLASDLRLTALWNLVHDLPPAVAAQLESLRPLAPIDAVGELVPMRPATPLDPRQQP